MVKSHRPDNAKFMRDPHKLHDDMGKRPRGSSLPSAGRHQEPKELRWFFTATLAPNTEPSLWELEVCETCSMDTFRTAKIQDDLWA